MGFSVFVETLDLGVRACQPVHLHERYADEDEPVS